MKTLLSKPILSIVIILASAGMLVAQTTPVNSSGSSADNSLTKWVGPAGNVITNSQVSDDGDHVMIGAIVPIGKATIQNGAALGPTGIAPSSDIGLGVTSETEGDLNIGIFAGAHGTSLMHIGTASFAAGAEHVNIGVHGEAMGVALDENIGVGGKVGSVSGETTGPVTLPQIIGVRGQIHVDDANVTATDARALEALWNTSSVGTVINGYGLYIYDIIANTDYGIYQESDDDLNVFRGKVVIGTQTITSGTHADFQLSVDGKVVAKEYVATLSNWADFVFSPGYNLHSIDEVESFIKTNGHLPGVPSAAEVSVNGMNVAEMNATLLQKIEELTLYIIEQDKRIAQLETQEKQ